MKKNKLLFILAAALVLLAALILLTGKYAGVLLSRLTGGVVNVEREGGKIILEGGQGDFSFEEGRLPQNFPKDFPAYTEAKLSGGWTVNGRSGEGISVIWKTPDSLGKVGDFYKQELPAAGWKITASFTSDNSLTFSFENERERGFLGITRAENVTTISVTLGAK